MNPTAMMRPLAVGAAMLLLVVGCGDDSDDASFVSSAIEEQGTDEEEATEATEPEDTSDTTADPGEEEESPSSLLLIMDASGSMNSRDSDGEPLIDGAKEALRGVVNEVPEDRHVGLRVYGHRYPTDDEDNGCRDTELIHPVEPLDRDALLDAIDGYDATGWTPIGLSLEEAAGDLPDEGERVVVLVSDGLDTCLDPDPCEVADDLADGGIDTVIHTVGFALEGGEADDARDQLTCIADAGDGEYFDADTADELAETLEDVVTREPRGGPDGAVLEGQTTPSQANTGQINTPYVDTIVPGERLFYHFEVPGGSQSHAEVLVTGTPGGVCDFATAYSKVNLVNASDNKFDIYDHNYMPGPAGRHDEVDWLAVTNPVEAGGDVFIRVNVEGDCDEPFALDMSLELIVE